MWVQDSSVDACTHCHTRFTLITRKHHCRKCGNIFCGACSGHKSTIPSYVPHTPFYDTTTRVCDVCYVELQHLQSAQKIVRVLALIDINVVQRLRLNKRWDTAVSTINTVFHDIPRKLGHDNYSHLERTLLHTHQHILGGHSCWTTRSICTIGYANTGPRTRSCQRLGCPPSCCSTLGAVHLVEILSSHAATHIIQSHRQWMTTLFHQQSTQDIIQFIPWWMQLGVAAQKFLSHTLFHQQKIQNKALAFALYFECDSKNTPFHAAMKSLLQQRLHKKIWTQIQNTVRFMDTVQKSISVGPQPLQHALLPYNTNVTVYSIESIKQLNSASAPHVVTLRTSDGIKKILIKTEDVRRDRCTMVICKLLERLCNTRCLSYPVLVTKTGGWIEMLPAKTLYALGNQLSTHILNQNTHTTVELLRTRFTKSVVGSCILSYMLGVGDRHLQNIVVTQGELAHIDFSYILGHDPKMEMTLRVTQPMIQMMGGKHSTHYNTFIKDVASTYTTMRYYTSLWCALMENIAHERLVSIAEVRNHVEQKLGPVASVQVVDIVKNHSDTWSHAINDMVHGIFQFSFT